jgi:hypothetical protein
MKAKAVIAVLAASLLILVWSRPAEADRYYPISTSWEIGAPGANTDAITDITWRSDNPLRLTIQCDTGTVVNVMVTRSGTENALGMNANSALTAGATYVFDVPGLRAGDTVNVQVETDSALPILAIGEVRVR